MGALFNHLTPAQAERLAMLAEEAGEIVQAVGKVLRHGYQSRHPNGGDTNRQTLERELGDLCGVMNAMCLAGEIDGKVIEAHGLRKWQHALRYTHHQGDAA